MAGGLIVEPDAVISVSPLSSADCACVRYGRTLRYSPDKDEGVGTRPQLPKGRAGDHLGGMSDVLKAGADGLDGSNHSAGGFVILCAQEHVRDVIAYWLSSEPAHVVVADDGYHAAKATDRGCRWLVTDRVLPPWPGLDTFATLRQRYPRLRIAYVENGNLHEGILARVTGASVLLQQPLDRRSVSNALLNGHS